jgi:hypothetical protein
MKMLLIALAAAALAGGYTSARANLPADALTATPAHQASCDSYCEDFLGALYEAERASADYAAELEAESDREFYRPAYRPHELAPAAGQ